MQWIERYLCLCWTKCPIFYTTHRHPLYLAEEHKVIMNDEGVGMTLALAIKYSEYATCSQLHTRLLIGVLLTLHAF